MWRAALGAVLVALALVTLGCAEGAVDVNGRRVDPLREDAPATLLLFVAEACPISNRYVPEINRLYRDYRARGLRMFLVYANPGSEPKSVEGHVADYKIEPPVLIDREQALVDKTEVERTPEAALFDATDTLVYRGRIDDRFVTYTQRRNRVTRRELRDAIEAVLEKRPVTVKTTTVAGCHIDRR